jgi:hypothetical protein
MKADAKPTLEEVASMLFHDRPAPQWIVQELRESEELIRYRDPTANDDRPVTGSDDVERLLFESAVHLQTWLPIYGKALAKIGEEYPDFIDDIDRALDKLIPFLAKDVQRPRDGKPSDLRLKLCAAVCLRIWKEVHHRPQPYSPKLQKACEAYWVACDHEGNPNGNVKQWERLLLWASSDHHMTTPE